MIIGVPKEIKNNENRVALTPAGTQELVKRGHTVYVQKTAGVGSGFSDEEYAGAGAKLVQDAAEAVRSGKVGDAYRDLVRGYFDRPMTPAPPPADDFTR